MAAALLAKMTASFHSRLFFFFFPNILFRWGNRPLEAGRKEDKCSAAKETRKKKISKRRLHCVKKKRRKEKKRQRNSKSEKRLLRASASIRLL